MIIAVCWRKAELAECGSPASSGGENPTADTIEEVMLFIEGFLISTLGTLRFEKGKGGD